MLRNSIRKHRRLVVAAAVIGAFFLAWIAYSGLGQFTADRSYRAAAREADRLDPGWREGIQESSTEPLPDDRNSASLVFSARENIPRGWSALLGAWPPMKLDPAAPLPSELLTVLRKRRDDAAAGLADARALADRPQGRFPEWKVEVPRGVPISRQKVETVAGLLYLDALVRIQEGDLGGAATDIRAMVNAGRSLGDEPSLAAQAGRVNAVVPAVATLERLLAQGQLPGPVLADLQMLLVDEAKHPLALVSLRGDRAADEKLNEKVRTGRAGVTALFESPGGFPPGFIYSWRTIRANQAQLLAENTRLVELAKLPAEQQGPALLRYQDAFWVHWNNTSILDKIYILPFHDLFRGSLVTGSWQARHRTSLHLAILALAGERFRLDHGRWPESPAELIPSYLSAVPYDPYSNGPMRWKRDGTGLVVYSVGRNGTDDGGLWLRGDPYAYGQDEGFRLDDPRDRKQ